MLWDIGLQRQAPPRFDEFWSEEEAAAQEIINLFRSEGQQPLQPRDVQEETLLDNLFYILRPIKHHEYISIL